MGETARSGWDLYWDDLKDDQRIFEAEAVPVVVDLKLAGLLAPGARVLDFGCGFGHVAAGMAPLVGEVWLWDQSATMRTRALARAGGAGRVLAGEAPPPDGWPEGTFDLVLVHSVVQYLTPALLEEWIGRWARLLRPGGRLLISDIPTPRSSTPSEVGELLRFAASRGFLAHAIRSGAAETLRYARRRSTLPLQSHDAGSVAAMAVRAGLACRTLERNIGYRRRRLSLLLERPA
jgi:SAM-dependent methyltransferase